MTFDSIDYVIFLGAICLLYWRLPFRAQNVLLLVGSYFFYGYIHVWFLIPFVVTTLTDYFVARGLETAGRHRRPLLVMSLIINLTLLGVFKYYNFFVDNVAAAMRGLGLGDFHSTLSVVLPVGISFYTFQSIGYVMDVYRGQLKARRNFVDYALFVAFFPQLVAGPIQRGGHLITQIERPRTTSARAAQSALVLFLWGMFKKCVVADNVAVICNKVFSIREPSFPVLWVGVLAFCVQIYADFSAYTDMARASARWLGIELLPNFNSPYLARSPSDFWQRWHISLSSWIRDYLYIPLGGSRVSAARLVFNVLFTFFLTGFWHGASWNYILWGLYYGVLTLIYRACTHFTPAALRKKAWMVLWQMPLMFVFTNIGWLIFREHDLDYLWRDLTLGPASADKADWEVAGYLLNTMLLYSAPFIACGCFNVARAIRPSLALSMEGIRGWTLQTVAATLLFALILVLHSPVASSFIYFQF